jgi:hypothetical protein
MSMLSKFVSKHKKALLTGARVIAAGVTRGKSEKIVGQLKGIGAAVKVYKGATKRPTKSEAAVAAKAATLGTPNIVPISSVKATTMPGGAKLKGVSLGGSTSRKRASVVAAPRKKAAAKARKPASGAKRKAPKGGKDFKALSASWKAAGKPGTWLAWVKSH